MKIFWFLNLAITLFTFAQNNYPIVFVHGFMGWGPGEMGDYNYWGGKKDFLSSLKKARVMKCLKFLLGQFRRIGKGQ